MAYIYIYILIIIHSLFTLFTFASDAFSPAVIYYLFLRGIIRSIHPFKTCVGNGGKRNKCKNWSLALVAVILLVSVFINLFIYKLLLFNSMHFLLCSHLSISCLPIQACVFVVVVVVVFSDIDAVRVIHGRHIYIMYTLPFHYRYRYTISYLQSALSNSVQKSILCTHHMYIMKLDR